MDAVIQGIRSLPALPMVVHELLLSIDNDDVDVGDLARKIALDPSLTARSLRLANSSFYGMANEVNTIQEAISILGFRTIRGVVTTVALLGAFPADSKTSFKLTSFWRHAIATALCARELAPFLKLNPEHAYTAGLLHDVGRLVLVTRFQSQYEATMAYRAQQDCSMLDAERAVLKIDHADVGHWLTKHWKFPDAMQQAVAVHHQVPSDAIPSLGVALIAADVIAHALDLSSDDDDCVPCIPAVFWRKLGVSDLDLLRIFEKVEKQFAGASLILST